MTLEEDQEKIAKTHTSNILKYHYQKVKNAHRRPWLMIKTIIIFLQEAFLAIRILNTQGIRKDTQILQYLTSYNTYTDIWKNIWGGINLCNNLSTSFTKIMKEKNKNSTEPIRCKICGILQKTGSSFLLLLIMQAI